MFLAISKFKFWSRSFSFITLFFFGIQVWSLPLLRFQHQHHLRFQHWNHQHHLRFEIWVPTSLEIWLIWPRAPHQIRVVVGLRTLSKGKVNNISLKTSFLAIMSKNDRKSHLIYWWNQISDSSQLLDREIGKGLTGSGCSTSGSLSLSTT